MPRSPSRRLRLAAARAVPLCLGPSPAEAYAPAEGKAPMTVTLVRSDAKHCGADCPDWLALTGRILPSTPSLPSKAFARIGSRRIPVLVDPPGGGVDAAIAMGRAIRARKLDVIVAGTALSQCGGGDRTCQAGLSQGGSPGFVAGGIAVCASACALLTESSAPTRDGLGFRTVLSIGNDGPDGAPLTLEMTDEAGRTLTIPTDGRLGALCHAVRLASGSAT